MIKGLFQRLKRREAEREPQAEPTFTATLTEIQSFKQLVTTSLCPGCKQANTLRVTKFAHTREGWEVVVYCVNCPSLKGVVNSNGFSFEGLEKDGKAKT